MTSGTLQESIGIETKGGAFTPLIERGTPLPARYSTVFTTADDYQPSLKIQVYQGDRALTADNFRLGTFELMIPVPSPKGVPQLEVTFQVDEYGYFELTATDQATSHAVTYTRS